MRQKMKHMAAALLALITVLAMGVVAFAAESTFSLSINTTSGHTYKIYQLATGTLSEDGLTLSDIEKGSSAKSDTTVDNITALADKTGAALGTAALELVDDSKAVETVTGDGKTIAVNNLKAGYYVVTDEYTDSSADHDGDTLSRAMVTLVKDTEITPKNTTVPSEKKINTGSDKSAVDSTDVDYNTANVGDNVPYVVESVVPDMTDYTKFYFVLRDTLSAGLTYNNDMKVYIDGTELGSDAYTVYTKASTKASGGTYIEVVLKNFIQYKDKKGAKIDFIYSATVNKNAVVGDAGNPNTENIVFSSDPTTTPEGDKDNPDKPSGITEESNPTGTTPTTTDEVKTYLTGIELLKVDATTKDALKGVVFSISGTGTKTTVHKEERDVFEEDTNGTYWLLKTGEYTTTAPSTEDTTVWTCYDENGNKLDTPHTNNEDHTGKCTYKTTKGNEDDYVSTETRYSLHTYTVETTENTPVTVSATATTGSDGKITFTGLAAGEYTITELKTLDGYNLLTSPINLTIAFDGTAISNKFTYTSTGAVEVTESKATENGIVKLEVENSKGTVLPSTGGIGTTIFYVVGSILVLAAAGLLIAGRKKESAK